MKTNFQNTDEYIANFPNDIQVILSNIRNIIKNEVPEAQEVISYQMPAFRLKTSSQTNLSNLSSRAKTRDLVIYFAAFKKHIGLFFAPTEEVYKHFEKELRDYKKSKGGIQLPLDKDIDYELVRKIVKFKKLSIEYAL